MKIILVGFKKSGKTTVGNFLANLVGKKIIDIDELIKKLFTKKYKKNKSIYEIYDFLKEESFRELETLAFEKAANISDAIIATSGGCVVNNKNLEFLKSPKIVIYIKVSKENLYKRIAQGNKTIFQDRFFFEEEYEKRKNIYESVADMVIEADMADFEKIAKQIKEKLDV
jgi:shikimate kinase